MGLSCRVISAMALYLICSSITAMPIGVVWEGTWYQAIPNRKGITKAYCDAHAPGTFRHVLRNTTSAEPVVTDKGIEISHTGFQVDEAGGIFLVHGELIATGTTGTNRWRDRIDFYFYKLEETGVTKGVWSTPECKGLYRAVVVEGGAPESGTSTITRQKQRKPDPDDLSKT